jgi:hypothetical protein
MDITRYQYLRDLHNLHQYIREQSHRKDIVGEFGLKVLCNPSLKPDDTDFAFRLAVMEFEICGKRTRREATELMERNEKFQWLLHGEPRLRDVIKEVLSVKIRRGYKFAQEFERFKSKISHLVGINAEDRDMRNLEAYELTLEVIAYLLPPEIATYEYRPWIERFNLDV